MYWSNNTSTTNGGVTELRNEFSDRARYGSDMKRRTVSTRAAGNAGLLRVFIIISPTATATRGWLKVGVSAGRPGPGHANSSPTQH